MTVSLIIFVLALAFVAYKLFRVREITVTGCETLSEDYVISLAGIAYDEFIFEVDTQEILDAIDNEPYIKPVSVEIVYPDCIAITIEERKNAACIEKGDNYLIIDDECYLLEVLPKTSAAAYPLVIGLQTDEIKVGQRLGVSDTYLLDVLSDVLTGAEEAGIGLLCIDMSLAADIVLETQKGFTVELGDDTGLNTKFALITSSIQELENRGKSSGTIDVASGESAYYREN